MGATVQARLDEETLATLETLAREHGMSRSEVLREGIRLVKQHKTAARPQKLIGIGCVDFGPGDLATNKDHLKNLGVKSMGKGWHRPQARSK